MHTPFDFLDLGSPHSVGMALMRLVRSGALRRLARGLYDVPRQHALLGELQPTADEIAQQLGTINYEVVTSILPRVPRR
mgnify:CR=1 FL=1